jgi:hypothetical protein
LNDDIRRRVFCAAMDATVSSAPEKPDIRKSGVVNQ